MYEPRIDSCHGKRAIEVANQYWRGKDYESESKPEARPAAARWPTGRPGEARSTAAGRPAEARSAAARWPAEPAEPLVHHVGSEAPHNRAGLRLFHRHSYR